MKRTGLGSAGGAGTPLSFVSVPFSTAFPLSFRRGVGMGGGDGSGPGFNASSSTGFSGSASNTRTSASCNEEVEAGAVDVDAEGSRERAASKSELRYSGVISSSSSSIPKSFSGRCTSDI